MYRTILAAVDQSPRAPAVLGAALELAVDDQTTVHLFQAVAVPQEFPAAAASPPDPLAAQMLHEAELWLLRLSSGAARVRLEPPELLRGQPWRAVVAAATRLEADLLVIGSHGFGGWDRMLGTTAARVVNHSQCNVLVVHEHRAGLR